MRFMFDLIVMVFTGFFVLFLIGSVIQNPVWLLAILPLLALAIWGAAYQAKPDRGGEPS